MSEEAPPVVLPLPPVPPVQSLPPVLPAVKEPSVPPAEMEGEPDNKWPSAAHLTTPELKGLMKTLAPLAVPDAEPEDGPDDEMPSTAHLTLQQVKGLINMFFVRYNRQTNALETFVCVGAKQTLLYLVRVTDLIVGTSPDGVTTTWTLVPNVESRMQSILKELDAPAPVPKSASVPVIVDSKDRSHVTIGTPNNPYQKLTAAFAPRTTQGVAREAPKRNTKARAPAKTTKKTSAPAAAKKAPRKQQQKKKRRTHKVQLEKDDDDGDDDRTESDHEAPAPKRKKKTADDSSDAPTEKIEEA
jgi:hypothetical protein